MKVNQAIGTFFHEVRATANGDDLTVHITEGAVYIYHGTDLIYEKDFR